MMLKSVLQISVLGLFAFVLDLGSLSADAIYDLTPYSLSGGFEIVGGTITTDGTVGRGQAEFTNSNILDYEVTIAGPINFTFTPTNVGASLFTIDSGLVVTEFGIWIEPSDVSTRQFRIEARETGINSLSIQQVFWSHGPSGNPASTVGFVAGGPGDQGSFSQTPRVQRLLIAGSANAVPEPNAGLGLISFALLAIARRYRNSPGE